MKFFVGIVYKAFLIPNMLFGFFFFLFFLFLAFLYPIAVSIFPRGVLTSYPKSINVGHKRYPSTRYFTSYGSFRWESSDR